MKGIITTRYPGATRPVSVVLPKMPPAAYKTYRVLAPLSTHWRAATCEEVGCRAHARGWVTTVPAGSRLEHTVRTSGRHWTSEERQADGTVRFAFPPGTECFESSRHRVRVRGDSVYTVTDGDWRGNPRGTAPRLHTRADDFVDDWATHQQRLADRFSRG